MTDTAAESILEWKGRTGPFSIAVNPGVFQPTHTSRTLADALEIEPGDVVIDVGCGSGVLSFVAAKLGAGRVYGCDISESSVEMAKTNAVKLGLADVTEFRAGSLLEPVNDVRADVIIGDVSGVPDDIALDSGWFPDGRAGGPTGAELPKRMLEEIADTGCLKPGGRLYLPTGTLQAENSILETARKIFGQANLHSLVSREFPLPDVLAKSKSVAAMMKDGILDLHARGSRLLWRLQIWRCELPSS